jgi:hypothetical protein
MVSPDVGRTIGGARRAFWVGLAVVLAVALPLALGGARSVQAAPLQCYGQTGFCVTDPVIWDYFTHRGGVATFGYPVSQAFQFEGFETQFFQRRVVQIGPDGAARLLNVLDRGLLPYTQFNGATIPALDPQLIAAAPPAGDAAAVQAFVEQYVPDSWEGVPVRFYQTFEQTVTCAVAFPSGGCQPGLLPGFDLELWGLPTSRAAADPNNANVVYQRFQRGVMIYDATCACTRAVPLGDDLKSILTGQNLPGDLEAQAQWSPLYLQYWPGLPEAVWRAGQLENTDLSVAFTPDAQPGTVAAQVAALNGCEWGMLQLLYNAGPDQPWAAYLDGALSWAGSASTGCYPKTGLTQEAAQYLVTQGLVSEHDGNAVIASLAVWEAVDNLLE